MTTATQVIDRAFRELAITQTGESLPANEAQDALDRLNLMLHSWRRRGIDLGHIDVELDETLAVEDDHILTIIYNLAVETAPEYGKEISSGLAFKATRSFDDLLSYYGQPAKQEPINAY